MNAVQERPRVLYAANVRVWIDEISRRTGRPAGLADISDRTLDELREVGVDLLWLLGVWPTGPRSIETARRYPDLQPEYRRALPDFTQEDVAGSPYAVSAYAPDPALGGDAGLTALREKLHRRGIGLILDFVANHTGLDHPWLVERPQLYVLGNERDLQNSPQAFFKMDTRAGTKIIAHGRDPYFPSWTDTAQLNLASSATREALRRELTQIAARCDGVRCDMAMLALPSIYYQTWRDHLAAAPDEQRSHFDFWAQAIADVRSEFAKFLFIAEVYWGREDELRQEGFQFTYDKILYDRLVHGTPEALRQHLTADPHWQAGCVRFLETHDEVRASVAMPWEHHRAAAVVASTVPGLSLLHDGQIGGRKIKVPIQLRRRPIEPSIGQIRDFYTNFLGTLARDPVIRRGSWTLLEARAAWPDNPTWVNFIAYLWRAADGALRLVVVNFGPSQGQCYIDLAPAGFHPGAGEQEFRDIIAPDGAARYRYGAEKLLREGLYLDMPFFGFHIFAIEPVEN